MWLPLVDQVTAAKAAQQILERDAEKGHQSLTTSETRKKEYEASVAKLTAELAVVTAQMAKLTVDHDRQKIDLATGAAAAADLAAQQKRLEGELVEVSAARDAALAALAEVEEKLKSVEATVTAMEAGGDAQAQDMAALQRRIAPRASQRRNVATSKRAWQHRVQLTRSVWPRRSSDASSSRRNALHSRGRRTGWRHGLKP